MYHPEDARPEASGSSQQLSDRWRMEPDLDGRSQATCGSQQRSRGADPSAGAENSARAAPGSVGSQAPPAQEGSAIPEAPTASRPPIVLEFKKRLRNAPPGANSAQGMGAWASGRAAAGGGGSSLSAKGASGQTKGAARSSRHVADPAARPVQQAARTAAEPAASRREQPHAGAAPVKQAMQGRESVPEGAAPAEGKAGITHTRKRRSTDQPERGTAADAGSRKRRFPERNEHGCLEEGEVAGAAGRLPAAPAPDRLRGDRWCSVLKVPRLDLAQVQAAAHTLLSPGAQHVMPQAAAGGSSAAEESSGDEGSNAALPLPLVDASFAKLDAAVQQVLLALVRVRLLRGGSLDAACLAELAALAPEMQHEAGPSPLGIACLPACMHARAL